MVTIFKTNVYTKTKARSIVGMLKSEIADCRINFDLEDCDKILRIEGTYIDEKKIIKFLNANMIQYEELL